MISQLPSLPGPIRGSVCKSPRSLAAKSFAVLVGAQAAKTIDGDAHALQLDVTDKASIAVAAARVREEFGRLDVLINNAAISHTGGMAGLSVEEYSKSIQPSNVSLDEVRAV